MTNKEESPPVPQVKYLCGTRAEGDWLGRTRRWDLGPEASSLRFKVPLTYINEAMSRGQQLGQGWLCPSDFCLLYLLWVPPGPSLSFITGSMLGL